jgi:hypothetical protein
MYLQPNTAMTRGLCIALIVLSSAASAAQSPSVPPRRELTTKEYENALERVLACPPPQLVETRDFQLCIVVVPPGHRDIERELLVVLMVHKGTRELLITQPERPLGWYAEEAKASDAPAGPFRADVRIKTIRTSDAVVVDRVLGHGWREFALPLLSDADWYIDATRYRLSTQRATGSMTAELTGPGISAKKQPSRLLTWLEAVRRNAELTVREQPSRTLSWP